jgi:diguanylate cyclase (GGDEF)-like protein
MSFRERFVSLLDALSALRQLSDIPVQECSETEFLERALNILIWHQDLEFCSVFTLDDGVLECVAGMGVSEQTDVLKPQVLTNFDKQMRFAVGEGLLGIAAQTGQIQYCRDCRKDERFKPFEQVDLFFGQGSLISVPIKSGDEVLGVLNVSHPMPEFFEAWHQHLLILFANLAGKLLQLNRLISDLESAVSSRTEELERTLQESEQLRHRYQTLSVVDDLTGLYNRRYFFAEGESMLARATRYRIPLSLMLIDIDHYKKVNDKWGHAVGDQVLYMIGQVMKEEVRAGDMVSRLGGDEFVIILSDTGANGADLLAKRIQQRAGEFDLGGEIGKINLTVSIGITTLDSSSSVPRSMLLDQLYHQADVAMYACKEQGRNHRMIYSPELERTSQVSGGP